MEPDEGYKEIKRFLKEHFGNEYKMSLAYMDKSFNFSNNQS